MDKIEYRKQYYQNNKERIKAYAREYYKLNKNTIIQRQRKYYKKWYRINKYKLKPININEPVIKKTVDRIIVRF